MTLQLEPRAPKEAHQCRRLEYGETRVKNGAGRRAQFNETFEMPVFRTTNGGELDACSSLCMLCCALLCCASLCCASLLCIVLFKIQTDLDGVRWVLFFSKGGGGDKKRLRLGNRRLRVTVKDKDPRFLTVGSDDVLGTAVRRKEGRKEGS